MTTKPPQTDFPEIDYQSLDFNPDEKQRPPDAMQQNPAIISIFPLLEAQLRRIYPSETVFLDLSTTVHYNQGNLNDRYAPDVYFALGVDVQSIRSRKLYLPWEAGKAPDFVLEVASECASWNDVSNRRDAYMRIGVLEYWRFDPHDGRYYGQVLEGERLVNGVYEPMGLTTEPDGILKGHSPILQRSLSCHSNELGLYDPATGRYDMNLYEERQARERAKRDWAERGRERAEREREQAEREREQLERETEEDRRARRIAEDRLRQLQEEELERRRREDSPSG